MGTLKLNNVTAITESGGTVVLDSAVTGIPAAGVTGTLPNAVQDNITRLGTVTTGSFVDLKSTSSYALNFEPATDGDGNTRSPIARDNKTWWYGDFGDNVGTGTYASGSVFTNVATGTNKSSETLPIGSYSAARTTTDNLGASYIVPSNDTDDVERNLPTADTWNISQSGMTMGCLFRNMHTGTGAKGVIFYGDTNTDNHFFTRTNYGVEGLIQCGGDTDGSDTWIPVTRMNTYANGWAFFVLAEGVNGSLHCSYNGSGYDLARAKGTATSPTNAYFGIFSDMYHDNDSSHKFATCFWYEGVMSEELIRAEYRFLKNKWSNITDLP